MSAEISQAHSLLARAGWAAHAYARYDAASVARIVDAVAQVAREQAEHFARWAVLETGSGVVEDKTGKNLRAAQPTDGDWVSPRPDALGELRLPRPRGVLLGLVPAGSPVSSVYELVLLALQTRNALVLSPDPAAGGCSGAAARLLAEAAVLAGAPDGVIGIAEPGDAVRTTLTGDDRVALVLDAAGPWANVPVLIDATADVEQAALAVLSGAAFDNSLPAGSESVLVVEESIAGRLLAAARASGAHLLSPAERDRLRALLFPGGVLDRSLIGKDAATLAARAQIPVADGTRVLLAPLDRAWVEEPLAGPKRCPVLGVVRVPNRAKGVRTAVGLQRLGAPGHCAVIHSTDPQAVIDYSAALAVDRIVVNQASYQAGTGLAPDQLVTFTRLVQGTPVLDLAGRSIGRAPAGPVPSYPVASNDQPERVAR